MRELLRFNRVSACCIQAGQEPRGLRDLSQLAYRIGNPSWHRNGRGLSTKPSLWPEGGVLDRSPQVSRRLALRQRWGQGKRQLGVGKIRNPACRLLFGGGDTHGAVFRADFCLCVETYEVSYMQDQRPTRCTNTLEVLRLR